MSVPTHVSTHVPTHADGREGRMKPWRPARECANQKALNSEKPGKLGGCPGLFANDGEVSVRDRDTGPSADSRQAEKRRITKAAAKAAGLKNYYTGLLCRVGHDSERLVSSTECIECLRERHEKALIKADARAKAPRTEARRAGQIRFLPDKPCARGHLSERYVQTGACVECLKIGYRAYHVRRRAKLGPDRRRYVCLATEVISREQAKAAGLKRYFTGIPCQRGHISERRVSIRRCIECDVSRDRARRAGADFPSVMADLSHLSEKQRLRRRAAAQAAWQRLNGWRRRLALRSRGSLSRDDVEQIGSAQKWKCANCRKGIARKYEIDHVMPLALGGAHTKANIQILCSPCNRQKHAKHPVRWAQENGRLL
jgi:5-methylcytosine-specific restriction endonuclease McrA